MQFPVVFELALAFLFTAYSLVVYSWIIIILQVKFLAVKWKQITLYIYIAINVAIYVSALVSGLFPNTVYYLLLVISGLTSITYLCSFWILKRYFTTVTSRLLCVLEHIANRVVGFHSIVILLYVVLDMPYSKQAENRINEATPYFMKIEIIAEQIVLLYNLRRMSTTPATISPSPSKGHLEVRSSASLEDTFRPVEIELSSDSRSLASNSENLTTTSSLDAILSTPPLEHTMSTRQLTRSADMADHPSPRLKMAASEIIPPTALTRSADMYPSPRFKLTSSETYTSTRHKSASPSPSASPTPSRRPPPSLSAASTPSIRPPPSPSASPTPSHRPPPSLSSHSTPSLRPTPSTAGAPPSISFSTLSQLPPSPPNIDPTTNFESYTFTTPTDLATSQTNSQVFTNLSAFNVSMTHPNLDSSGISQVFHSSLHTSLTSSSFDLSLSPSLSTSISTAKPTPQENRAALTNSSLSFNSYFPSSLHQPSSVSSLSGSTANPQNVLF